MRRNARRRRGRRAIRTPRSSSWIWPPAGARWLSRSTGAPARSADDLHLRGHHHKLAPGRGLRRGLKVGPFPRELLRADKTVRRPPYQSMRKVATTHRPDNWLPRFDAPLRGRASCSQRKAFALGAVPGIISNRRLRNQHGELLARIVHARLHRGYRNGEDAGDLVHALLVIIGEIDHLGVLGGQLAQRVAQHRTTVLVEENRLRVIGRIHDRVHHAFAQRLGHPPAPRRQRLEACDRQQPGRHRRARLEAIGMAPHVKKDIAEQVLGRRLVTAQANQPTIDGGPMPGEKHLHCQAVARCDALQQRLVRSIGG